MDVRADAAGGGEWVTDLRVKLNKGYLVPRRHYHEPSKLRSLMLRVQLAESWREVLLRCGTKLRS